MSSADAAADRPPAPRRRVRVWRLAAVLVLLVVALVLALPYLLRDAVRRRVATGLEQQTGATCRIDELAFGWLSGLAVRGLVIGNAPGFDPSHPFLRLASLRGDVGLLQLLRGRVDVMGRVEGLQLFVDQDESGRTNAEALFRRGARREPRGTGEGGDGGATEGGQAGGIDLGDLRLDLAMAGARIEIRRAGRLLESMQDVDARIDKPFGTDELQLAVEATLLPLADAGAGGEPGHVQAKLGYDAHRGRGDFDVTTTSFDLARYEPLALAFLPAGALTEIAGVADGTVRGAFDLQRGRHVQLDGDMIVQRPVLAGDWLRGMTVRSERWTLQPALEVGGAGDGDGAPRLAPDRFLIDLGFLTVRGVDPAAAAQRLGGAPGVALAFELDVAALAEFGGPMPAALRGSGAKASGTVALRLVDGALPPPAAMAQHVVLDATASAGAMSFAGLELQQLAATAAMRDGRAEVAVAKSTTLGKGPFALQVTADLRDTAAPRAELRCDWDDGQVGAAASEWLRWLVPLLAGHDGAAAFAAVLDLDGTLTGPAWRAEDENWLQFLNRWSGTGTVHLTDGRLQPAAALAGLLAPLGGALGDAGRLGTGGADGALAIDDLAGELRFANGYVETTAMKWLSKGKPIGLSGKVSLAGDLDYAIDLTALLREHRDGQRVLAALGDGRLTAGLTGTLDAPRLRLPDAQQLLRGLLQGKPEDLLKKGIELLGGKKGG